MKIEQNLKHINAFRDRHGKIRRYFRRPGERGQIPLPGEPGSSEFMTAYHLALAGVVTKATLKREIGERSRSVSGSLSEVIAGYYCDASFNSLSKGTRVMRRAILERFRKSFGDRPIAAMLPKTIAGIYGALGPAAQRNWRKTLRGLMQFAVAHGYRADDPTQGVNVARYQGGRIHTWTDAEIAKFEAQHPVGTTARLAMALLLYTGQRRSDMVRMSRQHFRGGKLIVRQQKTGMAKADEWLEIGIHPELARIITETKIVGAETLLVTRLGKPFSAAGFGNKMRDWCDAAGLPDCTAHGLRKAICRRLAEAGATAPQIAAISGHKSLQEVQRYIEQASQAKLAEDALGKLLAKLGGAV